jgi:hypothetical protein
MQTILEWLNGKKTYIVAICAALFQVAVSLGWLDINSDIVAAIDAIFLALFGVALRAGVTKSGVSVK